MKRLALKAFFHTRRLTIVGIILLALVLLSARLLAPWAGHLRGELKTQLEDILGMRVVLAALTVRLDGWSPRLTLTDVILTNATSGEMALRARELRLDLNLFATARARRLRIEGLTLVGADIGLQRSASGKIQVNGLQALGSGDDPGALAFFLREGHFALLRTRLVWTDQQTNAVPVELQVQQFVVVNQGRDHRLRLNADLIGATHAAIQVRARLHGLPTDVSQWSGEFYAKLASDGDLVAPVRDYLPPDLRLAVLNGGIETWWTLQEGRPIGLLTRFIAGTVAAERRPIRDARVPAQLTLHALEGLGCWVDTGAEQRLHLADLHARELGADTLSLALVLGSGPGAAGGPGADPSVLPSSSLECAGLTRPRGAAPGNRWLLGRVSDIGLPFVQQAALFAVPALAESMPEHLLNQPIGGRLRELRAMLALPDQGWLPTDWHLTGRVDGLALGRGGAWPGIEGIDLRFDAAPRAGVARVLSHGGTLDLRPSLAAVTVVDNLDGDIDWSIKPAGSLHLRVPKFNLTTPDLSAGLHAEFCLHRSASPYVNLHLQVRDGEASAIGGYLPVRILDPALVDWLGRAVRGGRLAVGDFVLRGRLEDFPFDDHQGRFLMDLRVEDATLDYSAPRAGAEPRPRWPALDDLDARIRILNRRLEISADRGRFLNSQLTQGSAVLPDLWHPERLFIKVQGQGPFADGRRVLMGTPLEKPLGRLADVFDVDGRLEIDLELDMPFRRDAIVEYRGRLNWTGDASATLKLGERLPDPELTDIRGQLEFSGADGIRATGIQVNLGQQALVIDAKTADFGAPDSRTLVDIRGEETPLQPLAERFPNPWWAFVDGKLNWALRVILSNRDFASAGGAIGLEFGSDLKGVSLSMPAPIQKTPETERSFLARTQLVAGRLNDLELTLGEVQARLGFSNTSDQPPRVRNLAIGLNRAPPRATDPGTLTIDGRLSQLSLTPWLDWWAAQRKRLSQPGGDGMSLRSTGLKVGRLTFGQLKLRDVDARLSAFAQGGTEVDFTAAELAGSVQLPAGGSDQPPRVSLARWRIEKPAADGRSGRSDEGPADNGGSLNLRGVGPLALDIANLEWGDTSLGHFGVRLAPDATGMQFRDLTLDGPLIAVAGEGQWRAAGAGETSVDLVLRSPDAGRLLNSLDLYKGLAGSSARIKASLSWPGGPDRFSAKRASGPVEFDFSAGRLLDLEPGVGRMLGILNIAAIQRRLSLDFSDVIDEGFSFDQATGRFSLDAGLARIHAFDLLSSTADIRIAGTTNLVTETFDQTLTVTPKVGAGVALASAVVGGPLVGAAVFLADKVAGDAVDRLTRHQYRVTGPWRDPSLELLGMSLLDAPGKELAPAAGDSVNPDAGAVTAGKGKKKKSRFEVRPDNLFLENF